MNDKKRACVAMACGILKNKGRLYSSIYDFKRTRYCLFGVNQSGKNTLSIFDYDRKAFFNGTAPNFFDYATSSHVQIKEEGDFMSGYDFQSSQFFSVTFNNSVVSIFDYEYSSFFHYSLI